MHRTHVLGSYMPQYEENPSAENTQCLFRTFGCMEQWGPRAGEYSLRADENKEYESILDMVKVDSRRGGLSRVLLCPKNESNTVHPALYKALELGDALGNTDFWIDALGDVDTKDMLHQLKRHMFRCQQCGRPDVFNELDTLGRWQCSRKVQFYGNDPVVPYACFTVRADHRPPSVFRWDSVKHAKVFPTSTFAEWPNKPIPDAVVTTRRNWGGGAFQTEGKTAVCRWDSKTAKRVMDLMFVTDPDMWMAILDDYGFVISYLVENRKIPHIEPGRPPVVSFQRMDIEE